MVKKDVRTILFDFDGVIADSLKFAFNWFGFAAEMFGINLPFNDPDGFRTAFIEPFPEFYKWLGFNWESDQDEIYRAYMQYHAHHPVTLVEGIEELLFGLSRRSAIKLGIVSSNHQQVLEDNLIYHRLAGYFDVVIGVDKDLSIPLKPDPTSLLMALSRLDASIAEWVYIGDQPSDVLTAKNAAWSMQSESFCTIAVTTGFATRLQLENANPKPDRIVDHPLEILAAL